jgi:ORF6N domain-containing protein
MRNAVRFPPDFAFQLTPKEAANLISQSVISSSLGGRRTLPRVFTEQGVAMLSSVLRSRRAIDVNIAIMRAFVHLRELISTHKDLAQKLEDLERKYDGRFAVVFDAIRELMVPSSRDEKARPRIAVCQVAQYYRRQR